MIYIIDGLKGITDFVEVYQSNIWNVQYFGQSDFQLITTATEENINKLAVGRYLVREEDLGDGFQNVMVIEGQKLAYDSDVGWMLTVTGRGLKSIVGRRIVWKQTTMSGTFERAVRQIINDNIINPEDAKRRITNFTMEAEKGYTDTADIQLLGENIADWLASSCESYGYGWDVYIKDGQYVFRLYKGEDRSYNQDVNTPVVFSEEYDNLLQSNYTHNREGYGNAALIGGEGEGVNKRTATIGDTEDLGRYEQYIDGSSVSSNGAIITVEQYMKLLEDYGKDQLTATDVTKFSGEILPDGIFKINEDYFLGDIVQIDTKRGITATPRIIEIIYAEDTNGFSVVPTFSEWEV